MHAITRTEKITELLAAGRSYAEIGLEVHRSAARVRQIATSAGLTSSVPSDYLAPAMVSFAAQVSEEVCATLDAGTVLTAPELREKFPGTTAVYLRAGIEAAGCVGLLGVASPPDKVVYSDEEILQALRAAWKAHGSDGEITGPTYDRLLEEGTIEGPSRVLIIQRIGSWARACERAGIPFRAARRTYDGYDEADLLSWVHEYAREQVERNQAITFAGYGKWTKTPRIVSIWGSVPSASLIKARFFGHKPWNEIRDEAILNAYRALPDDYFVRAER